MLFTVSAFAAMPVRWDQLKDPEAAAYEDPFAALSGAELRSLGTVLRHRLGGIEAATYPEGPRSAAEAEKIEKRAALKEAKKKWSEREAAEQNAKNLQRNIDSAMQEVDARMVFSEWDALKSDSTPAFAKVCCHLHPCLLRRHILFTHAADFRTTLFVTIKVNEVNTWHGL